MLGAKWASDILGREVTPDEARQLFGELHKEGRVVQRGPGFMVPFKEVPLIDHLTSVVDSNEERHGQRFITIDQLRENLPEGADLAQMQDIVGQLGSQGVQITESAPAAGRVPALQQRLDEVLPQYKGQPAAGVFQTEKGSIYLTHDDGTTTRHKEAREDVGHEGDFGWKERTQKTVYVDPLMVGGLSAAGLEGVGSRGARLLIKDGKATLALWNDATNKWGITPSLANVPVYDKPAPGLAPLELWNKKDDVPAGFEGYAGQHAGNKIVAMGPAPAIAPTEVTPTTEVTPAAEITPPATQEVAPQWQEMPAGADTMRTEKIANSATLLRDAQELWQGRTSFGQGLKSLLDLLTTETNRTTKEHAFALAGGEVVAFFSTNNKGMVRISDNRALATRMNDPGESILLTHSHPSNTSFSVGDVASFGDSPGEKISVVRGNKGFTAFMVRPDSMWTQRYGGLLAKAGRAAKKIAVDMVYKDPAVQGTREQKFLAYTRLQNLALARLGLIRYTDTAPISDLDFVPDWRAKIEKISKSMVAQNLKNQPSTQKAFADGNQYLDEHNRLAGSLGEPGGIERILQGPQAGAAGATQAGRPAGMARPAPTAPRTGAARSEARLSEALDRANDIAGEIEGWREGLSAQQEKEHRRHYASLTSEERTDPRAKLLKKLLDYINGTLKADQYALLDEVEATTDNYHPSVRAPEDPASLMGARDLRVQFTSDVRRLLKKWDEERNTGLLIHDLIRLNNNLQQRAETQKEKRWAERVRGELYIRERLLREERDGTIPTELRQLVEWLIKQNPAIVQDLGISVREGPEGERGRYNPANRVITLFRHAANPLTGVHEILHHTERMMPDDVRAGIRGEWLKRLEREHMQAARRGDKAALDFFDMVMERNLAGKALSPETFAKFMREQNLSRDYYQYVNPSEFWAENASMLVRERAKEGWVGKATRWLKGLAETIKKALGMRSDAPIMRALDDILAGRGKPAGKMLADLNIFPSVKKPEVKTSPRTLEEADYYQDNPAVSRGNTEWLLEKQRDADAWYRTTKGMNGAITAKFRNPVDLPVSVVSQVPGERDEQRKPGEYQFDRLLKKVRKEGWKPDPIDIYVNHRGEAFIYEGNTRAAVAKYLGIDTIPVYVGWLNGAEMVEGKWTPKNVLNMYPSEKAIVEPVRTPAAVAADVQQFQAINEQANTMLDEVSIPFSCRVKK